MFKLLGSLMREPDLKGLVDSKTKDNSSVLHLVLKSDSADKENPDFLAAISTLVALGNNISDRNNDDLTPMRQAEKFSGFWTNLFGQNPVVNALKNPKTPVFVSRKSDKQDEELSEDSVEDGEGKGSVGNARGIKLKGGNLQLGSKDDGFMMY